MKEKNTVNASDVSSEHSVGAVSSTPKRFRISNLFSFLGCLIVAFCVWLFVVSNDTSSFEQSFDAVPVSLMGVSELGQNSGMTVLSGTGHMVSVTVSGKKSDVLKLSAEEISAYVNVAELTTAERHQLMVNVSVPSGITLTRVFPDNVEVNVDRTSSRAVPVLPKLASYSIGTDCVLGKVIPEIEDLTISGPMKALDQVDHAEVQLGDVGTLTDSKTATGPVRLVDANGDTVENSYLRLSQDTVKCDIPIEKYVTIPVSVNYKYGYYNSDNVEITVSPSEIKVKGSSSEVSQLSEYAIVIDEKKTSDDSSYVEQVNLPSGIENVDHIENIEVSIRHRNTQVTDIIVEQFKLKNPNNLNYKINTESITIRLRGPVDVLTSVDPEKITAVFDLSTMSEGAGTVSVPVSISIPSVYPNVYEVGEYKIEISIE